MIDVMVTMRVNEEPLTLFGKVDEKENRIVLNYQILSKAVSEVDLIHHRPMDIPLLDTEAHNYTAYGCKFTKQTTSISAYTVQVEGTFTRLLKERNLGATYNSVSFSFTGIEKIFPLDCFSTQSEEGSTPLTFTKELGQRLEYTLMDSISCRVESTFAGVKSSSRMYDLCVKQSKTMVFNLPDKHSVDALLVFVVRVKQYFEFILGQEIGLRDVAFYNKEAPGMERGEIIFEPLLLPKTFLRTVKDNPYRESFDTLFAGLNGWMVNYDAYQRVIEIWQKSIYNLSVSKEDLFIWRCQAFELLCTLNPDIFQKADSLKAHKQQYPNLKNFLSAIKALYGIINVQPEYFRDVKDVRDVLTHNNPTKSVSDNQKKNSYSIMEVALSKAMAQIFGIKGIPTSLGLGKAGI